MVNGVVPVSKVQRVRVSDKRLTPTQADLAADFMHKRRLHMERVTDFTNVNLDGD